MSFDMADIQRRAAKLIAIQAEWDAKPLIEQNAIKLAELERDWAVLGPLRPITFSVYLDTEEEKAKPFANGVRQEGFDVTFSQDGLSYGWYLDATRTMEPSSENVTQWEEWFRARADEWLIDEESEIFARFEGWTYPKTLAPMFSLGGRKWSHNEDRDRAKIIFGSTLCPYQAPYGKYAFREQPDEQQPPFQIDPSEFLRVARDDRPTHPEPTASGFAQWIYSLYGSPNGDAQDRENGTAAEEHIFAQRRAAYGSSNQALLRTSFPDWRLVHNGLQTSRVNHAGYFTIDDLPVNGEPLRVLPDLVYRNETTAEMIIVEIKHSRMVIPCNLWPNVWGQLWCYSQMKGARAAPKLTVIGEVWGDEWARNGDRFVRLRASVRRDPRASAYDRFFRALFDIYRGVDDA